MASAETAVSLVASGNTTNPCLIVLRRKGYEVWLEKGDAAHLWCARKGEHSFLAYTAPELLGLFHRQPLERAVVPATELACEADHVRGLELGLGRHPRERLRGVVSGC